METPGAPSKLNEAFKVDISLSNIEPQEFANVINYVPPSSHSIYENETTTNCPLFPSPILFHPFRRKLPGNNSKPCPPHPLNQPS